MHPRPSQQDYPLPFHTYIKLVPDGDVVETLSHQLPKTRSLLARVTEEQAGFRYAEGKWSIRQVLGHVIDSERIFSYRVLRMGRNDKTPLPGFDQDVVANGAPFDSIPLADIWQEFEAVRASTLCLLKGLQPEAWERSGTSDGQHITVRSIAFAIAGHELHHRAILEQLYLPPLA